MITGEIRKAAQRLRRVSALIGMCAATVFENPTEELVDGSQRRGRLPKLFHMDASQPLRVEENYLYSTRRWPTNTANDTIGSGAVAANDYAYFNSGIGDQASNMGYSTAYGSLTQQQTNMASGGKIPSGRAFRLFDLGVSFNAGAVPADVSVLLDSLSLAYKKQAGQLQVTHGPLRFWPGGTGLYGYAATTVAATSIQAASNGMPSLGNVRRFSSPRVLSSNEDFSYVVTAQAKVPATQVTIAITAFTEITVWMFGQVIDAIPT